MGVAIEHAVLAFVEDLLDRRLAFTHAIQPLDLTHNALDRRARRDKPSQVSTQPITPASEAFEDDFRPIVDPDGNYHDPEEKS